LCTDRDSIELNTSELDVVVGWLVGAVSRQHSHIERSEEKTTIVAFLTTLFN